MKKKIITSYAPLLFLGDFTVGRFPGKNGTASETGEALLYAVQPAGPSNCKALELKEVWSGKYLVQPFTTDHIIITKVRRSEIDVQFR